MKFNVYVPNPLAAHRIDPGSGIVGELMLDQLVPGPPLSRDERTKLCIDYEGNRYQAVNIVTWADRVYQAAGRQMTRYPTIARSWVNPDDMELVGEIDMETGVVTLKDLNARHAVRWWLDLSLEDVPDAELHTTNHRHLEQAIKSRLSEGSPGQEALRNLTARRAQLAKEGK